MNYEELSAKQIIGLGENVHGGLETWYARMSIIRKLAKYRKVHILLEENNKLLKQKKYTKMYPHHNTPIFKRFHKMFKVTGVDNHPNSSKRNYYMARDIIRVIKSNSDVLYVFLAFDTHVSFYDQSMKPTWKSNIISYNEPKEVGAYLKEKYGHKYVSIGIVSKKGTTYARQSCVDCYSKIRYKNHMKIRQLTSKRFYSGTMGYKYVGYGPFKYCKYNTKWLDMFYIISKTTVNAWV